jgi:hypothetical protein
MTYSNFAQNHATVMSTSYEGLHIVSVLGGNLSLGNSPVFAKVKCEILANIAELFTFSILGF